VFKPAQYKNAANSAFGFSYVLRCEEIYLKDIQVGANKGTRVILVCNVTRGFLMPKWINKEINFRACLRLAMQ
jgi:hypothetical protein